MSLPGRRQTVQYRINNKLGWRQFHGNKIQELPISDLLKPKKNVELNIYGKMELKLNKACSGSTEMRHT